MSIFTIVINQITELFISFYQQRRVSTMYNLERQSEIINLIQRNGSVKVSELSETFCISKETIRRDLCELEESGALKRTHGGAIIQRSKASINSTNYESPIAIRNIHNVEEKQLICKTAAATINNGDTIFIDNSSTCLYLYQYIPSNIQVTFLTNSIPFLIECSKKQNPNHTIVCLGGIFKSSNLSIYGNITIKNAAQYYPNKAFISCTGIHSINHITDSGIHEIDVKKTLLQSSQIKYLLADYTKFGQIGQVYLSDLTAIDFIITDSKTNLSQLHYLDYSNVKVIVAK